MRSYVLSGLLAIVAVLAGCVGERRPGALSYVAVGASDAVGIGALPLTQGYVYRIRAGLAGQGREVTLTNLGLPGATADVIRSVTEAYVLSRPAPDVVTVWVGANDVVAGRSPEAFREDLHAILASFPETTLVAVANLPDLSRLLRFEADHDPAVTRARVLAFNRIIAAEAAKFDDEMVDLSRDGAERSLITRIDGYHPNDAGHARIAARFLEVLQPGLGERASAPSPVVVARLEPGQ